MSRRKSISFVLLAALVLMSAWTTASAAPRQCVIVEGFTQWNCPPCATWNPQEAGVLNQMTRDSVVSIKYHVTWPGTDNDVFNHWNVAENGQRTSMYGVSAVPDGFIDGADLSLSTSALRNAVRSHYAQSCPCTINITALYSGSTTVSYTGSIDAEASVSGLRLFVALITNEEHAPPQGSNGETEWFDVFRDMSPNASSGLTLTVGAGESQDFSGTLNCDASWDAENMHVVAFVQNVSTHQIVQGANTIVEQNYGMNFSTVEPYQRMINPGTQEYTYSLYIDHVGLLNDNYTVQLTGDFPDGWTHSIESNGVSPQESSIQVPLANLETAHLLVRVNPNSNPGFAEFTVSAVSNNEPLVYDEATFRIMGGLDLLVVDDDGGDTYETYFMNALTPFAEDHSLVVGLWDMNADMLDNSYFGTTDAIIWFTGNTFQNGATIGSFDQVILGDYLNSGGRLLLSGQGIGFDIRTDQFMSQHLHMHYVLPWPQGDDIVGYAGDPISAGMSISLDGGSGADNQSRQHRVIAIDEYATPFLRFDIADDSADCGMRIETSAYRVLYFAFGLEGINSDQVRTDLMSASLGWLMEPTAVNDAPVTIPLEFSLGQNYPNPFNPETVIPFTLAERSLVTLNVYDVLGRQVARLASGMHEAGAHSLNWNASQLSSGIYFYSLKAESGTNSFSSTRKMVLMK